MKPVDFSDLRLESMQRIMTSSGMAPRLIRRRMIRGLGALPPLITHADSLWPRQTWDATDFSVMMQAQGGPS